MGLPDFVNSRSKITSPETSKYNCIAWAFGSSSKWWWPCDHPDAHWPMDCAGLTVTQAFDAWFNADGWQETQDLAFDPALVKIALFAKPDGEPTHAARLIATDTWTSKLGHSYDVSHGINELNGPTYGRPIRIYSKPIR